MRETITHETGIVTGLNGDTATVKVDRVINLGRCCAKMELIQETLVKVKNSCDAVVNDRVLISSDYELVRNRNELTFCGIAIGFATGAACGKIIFSLLGLSAGKPLSLGLGFALGLTVLFLLRNFFRKNPLPKDTACKILT